jgi:hypothetical protein
MRIRLLRRVVPVVVAGLLTTTGCSSTPTSQATVGSTVHLTDYTDNDGPTSTVILAGVIGDYGTAVRSAGTLANLTVNSATCSATTSVTAAVPIVVGSGTGSCQGIAGTFTLTVTLDEVFRPTACSETGEYLAQSIVVAGSGTVTLG